MSPRPCRRWAPRRARAKPGWRWPTGELFHGESVGLGPRVPMIVVSPWTKGGWVNSQVFDHTSVIRFLEARFGVQEPNITPWRRAVCGDLDSASSISTARRTVAAARIRFARRLGLAGPGPAQAMALPYPKPMARSLLLAPGARPAAGPRPALQFQGLVRAPRTAREPGGLTLVSRMRAGRRRASTSMWPAAESRDLPTLLGAGVRAAGGHPCAAGRRRL